MLFIISLVDLKISINLLGFEGKEYLGRDVKDFKYFDYVMKLWLDIVVYALCLAQLYN